MVGRLTGYVVELGLGLGTRLGLGLRVTVRVRLRGIHRVTLSGYTIGIHHRVLREGYTYTYAYAYTGRRVCGVARVQPSM
jgi:hypothetical protein